MIDIRVQTLGGPEIAAKLTAAESGIREAIRDELAQIGDEIVATAQANAPKDTGIMASKILWYFGERKRMRTGVGRRMATGTVDPTYADGRIRFTAMPTGSVAHLMERGVSTTREAHFRNVTRKNVTVWTRKGKRTRKEMKGKAYVQAHPFNIAPRPFFMPAVDSVGGASGVNARLQAKLDFLAGTLNRAA